MRDLTVRTTLGRTLVRDVGFELERGQTLGIVGESGSGKSMTARAVMRVLAENVVSAGQIEFDGVDLAAKTERELRPLRGARMNMVLQDPFTALNPLMTVGQHIRESLPPAIRRHRSRSRSETAARLDEVGLEAASVADRYPFQLSGGMRQRVVLAAALAADPELLIADEPTTALDVTTQADILALLSRLQRTRAMALVLITHDLRVAFSVCDRVLVMYAGSVVEDAPATRLVDQPEHPYTIGLLGAEPPISHYAEELTSIPGNVPAADSVAEVCSFADRCQWQAPECVGSRPPLALVAPQHRSACRRSDELRPELRKLRQHLSVPSPQPAPSGKEPILTVTDLVKSYRVPTLVGKTRVTTAVNRVSFTIAADESLGLVGETGSGKTTIARCLLGLEHPDGGEIALSDIDISDYRRLSRSRRSEVRRLVQVVFQDPYSSLNAKLTIGATLAEAVRVRSDAGQVNEEIAELLTMVGLPAEYAERRPGALSGGERQRVAIARAIAVRPQLLICDEPVAALDVSVQAQVLELLREIRGRYGTSFLFITHDLSVVRQMTERAIVLQGGEIVESGSTSDVLDHPQHPYTTRLIESIPT
ncbi:ABC transporter ATP-binding protein [Amycolatopsis jejuensis]|uniref:dipeptide ABC transporter ATP-binding protein n=1 Tax=Amycolatopsis jejuensis TaxID=330084 RepID=UPI001FE1D141|nr:ABC transporter ATP-binding protein [Amycolatopsis jejuensis]